MKTLAINQSNSIFSRMKDNLECLRFMFDGNKYTTENNETENLPDELRTSLQNIEEQEKQIENGTYSKQTSSKKSSSKVKTQSRVNIIKPITPSIERNTTSRFENELDR